MQVVRASGESSPAHARNAGAAHATRDWILFLDADCEPAPDLLDAYFSAPVDARVGALAGVVVPAAAPRSVAERYATARNFLGQEAHLAHPYLPRAVAANLLVRRAAFEALGGFVEGVRAGEDTDFSWRLQQAGWLLEPRPARVAHTTAPPSASSGASGGGTRPGGRGSRTRYEGFTPEPALARALRRRPRRVRMRGGGAVPPPRGATACCSSRWTSSSVSRSCRPADVEPRPGALMRVHVVDPSAFTPPYDHALSAALARAGASVELITSEFAYGSVPAADGYEVREWFYRHALGAAGLARAPRDASSPSTSPTWSATAGSRPRDADVVHFQWLDVQWLDGVAAAPPRRSC